MLEESEASWFQETTNGNFLDITDNSYMMAHRSVKLPKHVEHSQEKEN